MNEEIKRQWIDALRSGKYKQGHEELYDGTGYCCLGVLTNIINPNHDALGVAGFLPLDIAVKCDLVPPSTEIGKYYEGFDVIADGRSLIDTNDAYMCSGPDDARSFVNSFEDIADLIENAKHIEIREH